MVTGTFVRESVPKLVLVIEILKSFVTLWLVLSETWTVNVNEPVRLGVPLMVPEFKSPNPSGTDPLVSDQVYGGEPPAAFNVVV